MVILWLLIFIELILKGGKKMLDRIREKLVRIVLGNRYDNIDELLQSIEDLTAMNTKLQKENMKLQVKLAEKRYTPYNNSIYTFTFKKNDSEEKIITHVMSEDEFLSEIDRCNKLIEKAVIREYTVKEAGIHSNILKLLQHMNMYDFARLVKDFSHM